MPISTSVRLNAESEYVNMLCCGNEEIVVKLGFSRVLVCCGKSLAMWCLSCLDCIPLCIGGGKDCKWGNLIIMLYACMRGAKRFCMILRYLWRSARCMGECRSWAGGKMDCKVSAYRAIVYVFV